jgi:hypothetical protein
VPPTAVAAVDLPDVLVVLVNAAAERLWAMAAAAACTCKHAVQKNSTVLQVTQYS